MKTGVKIMGGRGLIARFKAYPSQINRTIESVVIQEARALAVEYGSATMPGPGMQEGGNAEAFRKTVEADVRRVFASRSDPNQVFRLLQAQAPQYAAAYWHAYKSKKPRAMAAILTKANLPQGLDPGAHSAARVGKNGRVAKNQKPVSLANEASLRVFVRKQRALVGFAKAGWLCAAKGLGGRVRRNVVSEGGKRGTEEIFPKYVRSIAGRYPDIGGADVTSENGRVTVSIYTNVRHADVALSEALYLSANTRAEQRMNLALANSIRALNSRTFKSTAA